MRFEGGVPKRGTGGMSWCANTEKKGRKKKKQEKGGW